MATSDASVMKRAIPFSAELLDSGWLADVEIQCGKRCFKAHKLILCGQSKWFQSALMGDFLEAKTGVINITNFKAEEVSVLLKFLYTGSVEITPAFCDKADNPFIHQMRLYHLAESFQVAKLRELVCQARDDHTLALSKQLCRLSAEAGQAEATAEQLFATIEELYGKYQKHGTYPANGVRFAFKFNLWRLAMSNVHEMVQSPRFRILLNRYSMFAVDWASLLTDVVGRRGSIQQGEIDGDAHCAKCQLVLDPQTAVVDTIQWTGQGKVQALCDACFELPVLEEFKKGERFTK